MKFCLNLQSRDGMSYGDFCAAFSENPTEQLDQCQASSFWIDEYRQLTNMVKIRRLYEAQGKAYSEPEKYWMRNILLRKALSYAKRKHLTIQVSATIIDLLVESATWHSPVSDRKKSELQRILVMRVLEGK